MNASRWKHLLPVVLTIALFAAVSPARAGVSDAWITTKVKMLLLNSPSVGGMAINVDTDDGRVTLLFGDEGWPLPIGDARGRRRHPPKVSHWLGSPEVRNLLQVVAPSRRAAVKATDAHIKTAVTDALAAEHSLSGSSVDVKSVDKGVVLLSGKAETLSDHLLAMEVTAAVPGVKRVASQIESPDEFGDREIWFEDSTAPAVGAIPGTPAVAPAPANAWSDGWITTQVKMRFMTEADMAAGDVHVDTHRGVVTLFGTVPTRAAGDLAVRSSSTVPGVRSVTSELRIVSAAAHPMASAADDVIANSIRKRLTAADLKDSHITVDVKSSTARLSGTVMSASHRYSAVSVAYGTPGVHRVQNDLRIETVQTSQR